MAGMWWWMAGMVWQLMQGWYGRGALVEAACCIAKDSVHDRPAFPVSPNGSVD
jgi:hypothetical protein